MYHLKRSYVGLHIPDHLKSPDTDPLSDLLVSVMTLVFDGNGLFKTLNEELDSSSLYKTLSCGLSNLTEWTRMTFFLCYRN